MSSDLGKNIRLTIFGESHGDSIGVVIDGLPAGQTLDLDEVAAFMQRRAPGQDAYTSARREDDRVSILSGLFEGKTCGAPLCAVIENRDERPHDYEPLRYLPRPGQSDFTTFMKYGHRDHRGGGHLSGRLTAPLCFAGSVAKQLLAKRGVRVGAHLLAAGDVFDRAFDPVAVTENDLLQATTGFPTLDAAAETRMKALIDSVRAEKDTIGGQIECCALGLPAGLGEPIFDGVENRLAAALFAIPAITGVEFGDGFAGAATRGSAHNDAFCSDGLTVRTATNRHGGILGGITSGMPLLLRVAVKPTPSTGLPQQSVDLRDHSATTITVGGRHDPCIAVRAVPCVEAACAVVLLDLLIESDKRRTP